MSDKITKQQIIDSHHSVLDHMNILKNLIESTTIQNETFEFLKDKENLLEMLKDLSTSIKTNLNIICNVDDVFFNETEIKSLFEKNINIEKICNILVAKYYKKIESISQNHIN